MVNSFQLPRALIAYAIAIPLALVLGFFLIVPESGMTWMLIGCALLVAILPLLLRHHHVLLVLGWSAYVNAFFLPGQPPMWLLLAVMSFGISFLDRIITGKRINSPVRLISFPLLFIVGITVFTALYRGGIGVRALGGDSYGGKSYFFIIGAVLGYFALAAKPIQRKDVKWIVPLFFLSSITAVFSNVAYALGPSFYFLFNLFPAEFVLNEAAQDYGGVVFGLERIVGLSFAATALFYFLLARYGISGLLDVRKPWRGAAVAVTISAVLFGGFRSFLIWVVLLGLCQLVWERLPRRRYLLILGSVSILAGLFLVAYADKMPLSVQRAVSFLPINVDPMARRDAVASTEWRIEMWHVLMPQIPQYFWIGKGYSIDPTDLYLSQEAVLRGLAQDYEPHIVAGSYHSGPLSTILPLGIWGCIGLVWMWVAGLVVLYRNYRYGDESIRQANTFLLAFFAGRIVFYLFVFGAFNTELATFTGILGLSVSINGGLAKRIKTRRSIAAPAPITSSLQPAPA